MTKGRYFTAFVVLWVQLIDRANKAAKIKEKAVKIDTFNDTPILRQKEQTMTATINGIPLYQALIKDYDTGMLCISLVDKPAVESDFVAFDEAQKVPLYCVANEEQQIVRGVVMRANFPIYRRSDEMGEYYITFSADTIRKMAEKYIAEYRQNNTTLYHIAGSYIEGINLVQYFIKDSAKGIDPVGFETIENGSLFAEFQIHDTALWEQVKNGSFKGFSLEGVFALEPVKEDTTNSNTNMSKMQKFKEALAKLIGETFAQVTTDKGVLRWETDDDLKAGDKVFYIDEEGNETKPEDGDYKTEDGKVIKVADGKVAEIVDDKAEVDEEGNKTEEKNKDTPDYEERIAKLEEVVAGIEERLAKAEKRIAEHGHEEALQAVTKEVAELREQLAKAPEKGIEQQFEEQNGNDTKNDNIARLAQLRDEALK